MINFVFVLFCQFQGKVILTRYPSNPGNTLGTFELNSVGGPNLCSLDVHVLQGINNDSLK